MYRNISRTHELLIATLIILFLVIGSVLYLLITKEYESKNSIISIGDNSVSIINNGKVIQSIPFAQRVLTSSVGVESKDLVQSNQDINFDGHNDIAILSGIADEGESLFYDFYFYKNTTGTFTKDEVLVDIANPTFNAREKSITSVIKTSEGDMIVEYVFNGTIYEQIKINTN